eukprot:239418_1
MSKRKFQSAIDTTKTQKQRQKHTLNQRKMQRKTIIEDKKKMLSYIPRYFMYDNSMITTFNSSIIIELLATLCLKCEDRTSRPFSVEMCRGIILSWCNNIQFFSCIEILAFVNKYAYILTSNNDSKIYAM